MEPPANPGRFKQVEDGTLSGRLMSASRSISGSGLVMVSPRDASLGVFVLTQACAWGDVSILLGFGELTTIDHARGMRVGRRVIRSRPVGWRASRGVDRRAGQRLLGNS
jgi:hypothetical protein